VNPVVVTQQSFTQKIAKIFAIILVSLILLFLFSALAIFYFAGAPLSYVLWGCVIALSLPILFSIVGLIIYKRARYGIATGLFVISLGALLFLMLASLLYFPYPF